MYKRQPLVCRSNHSLLPRKAAPFVWVAPKPKAMAVPPALPPLVAALPDVAIKDEYRNVVPPQPSCSGGRTGKWPLALVSPSLAPTVFTDFLRHERNLGGATLYEHELGLARLLNMVTVGGKHLASEVEASDPKIIVAIYMRDVHKALFKLPILSEKYSWTRNLVNALKVGSAKFRSG